MTKIAFIFPGQGAQSVGMGRELYDQSSEARKVFDEADGVIAGLSDVMFNGPAEKLTTTAFCQAAIYTMSMAGLAALKAHAKCSSLEPVFACGLSLGEYSALTACGALNLSDTLKLVERRGSFMDEATRMKKGAMAAVIGFDRDKIVEICQATGAEVANFNSPDQTVITGDASKVEEASVKIKEAGAKRVIPLDVSGAFHSSLMRPAAEKFKSVVADVSFDQPTFDILSNVDAQPTKDVEMIRANLSKQITSSVQWVKTVEAIVSKGVTTFIEIGPGTVLKGLIRKINPELKVFNIQKPEDIDGLEIGN